MLLIGCGDPEAPDDRTVIEGRLFEAGSERALDGRVSGFPDLGTTRTSLPDGTFRFEGARYGQRYQLEGEADGYITSRISVIPEFGVPTLVRLALRPSIACAPGERRCAAGAAPGIETCTDDGRGFVLDPCPTEQVCEPDRVACVGTANVAVVVEGSGSVVSIPGGLVCHESCGRRFALGTELVLEARSSGDSAFDGWGGDCAGSEPSCALTLNGDRGVQARFRTTAFRLTVGVEGGPGSVTSVPEGIDACDTTCQRFFLRDTQVNLTATPGPNRELQRWEGDCEGSSPTCTVAMSEAREVRARFRRPGQLLEVVKEGTGAGTVTSMPPGIDCGLECEAAFSDNRNVTLTAEAAVGSRFEGWGGACAESGVEPTCEVRMSEPRTVVATFAGETVEIEVALAGAGAGEVRSTPPGIDCGTRCAGRFPVGEPVELEARAGPGAVFFEWGAGCASAGEAPTCTVTPSADLAVQARFEPFFLAPLPADPACQYALSFEPPERLRPRCASLPDATALGWAPVPSRGSRLGDALLAPSVGAPIDLGRPGPASAPATLELTARRDGAGAGTLFMDHEGSDPRRAGLFLRVLDDGRLVANTYDGQGRVSSATTAVSPWSGAQWAHIAVVLEAMDLAIFVDGVEAARATGPLRLAGSSSTAWVGAARDRGMARQGFVGAIDELRISDQARY